MRLEKPDYELDVSNQSVETLLLMTVLGPKTCRKAAVEELKRRGSLAADMDGRDDLFMTNLSGIC